MRIALGIRDFIPSKGGAERYLVDLMRFLSMKGHEVHVFAHHFDEGIEGLRFHKVEPFSFPKWLRILSFALRCHQQMEGGGFDVIMGVGNTWGADLLQPHGGVHWKWFWRSLRAYDNPWLWTAKLLGRAFSLKQWAEGIVEDAPYRKGAKRIVAISEMVKQDIVDHYGIPEDRIVVVYNGVDTEHFHPRNRRYREEIRERYGLRSGDFVLLFVSHNFRLKGLRYLIQALALIKRKGQNVKLLVIGRDKAGPYRRLAKKLGCADDVFFAGGVNDLERYYSSADMLVHPTFYDACSLVVLEALASGLPVITTRYNGAGGIISEGHEGCVLADPRDVRALTEAIVDLFDSVRLKQTAVAARALAVLYSQEKSHQAMMEAIKSTVT